MWLSGLEMTKRKLGVRQVVDLSATPFFLRGSGYAEGTLFPWTASDFSLMDAIECGIVKLPRVPVADNIPGADVPVFRNLLGTYPQGHASRREGADRVTWTHWTFPRRCRLPSRPFTATTRRLSRSGRQTALRVHPVSSSSAITPPRPKLVYDYISGFERPNEDGYDLGC